MLDDLYETNRAMMLSFISKQVGWEHAEDILQTAWAAVLGSIDPDHPTAVAMVWQSVRFRIVDHIRSHRDSMPLDIDPGEMIDIGDMIDGREMMAAVGDLRPHLRDATHTIADGLSHRDAGKVLGISHTAASNRRTAGLDALRARFRVQMGPE